MLLTILKLSSPSLLDNHSNSGPDHNQRITNDALDLSSMVPGFEKIYYHAKNETHSTSRDFPMVKLHCVFYTTPITTKITALSSGLGQAS